MYIDEINVSFYYKTNRKKSLSYIQRKILKDYFNNVLKYKTYSSYKYFKDKGKTYKDVEVNKAELIVFYNPKKVNDTLK